MEIITGMADSLPVELLRDLALYRHRVFVEMLGWDLVVQDGMELDQFDCSDTLYVIERGQEGAIDRRGTASANPPAVPAAGRLPTTARGPAGAAIT